MIEWKQHRLWMGMLTAAIALLLFSSPLLDLARDKTKQHQAHIKAEHSAAQQSLQQLRADIAAAQKLSAQIDPASVTLILAPVNRLQTASTIEHIAADMRLSHLTYTLSPEKKMSLETSGVGSQKLATSTITLSADTVVDTDAFAFIERLRHALPGRLHLRQFSLERINTQMISSTNLRFTAVLDWLSNGTTGGL